MKKYLLFAGEDYYPNGGVKDLMTDADTIEELETWFNDNHNQLRSDFWGQIVLHETMEKVKALVYLLMKMRISEQTLMKA